MGNYLRKKEEEPVDEPTSVETKAISQHMKAKQQQSSPEKKKTPKRNGQIGSASPGLSSPPSSSDSKNTPKDEGQASITSNGLPQNGQLAISSKTERKKCKSKNEFKPEMPVKKVDDAASPGNGPLPHQQGPGTSSVGPPSQIEPSLTNEIEEEDIRVIKQVR